MGVSCGSSYFILMVKCIFKSNSTVELPVFVIRKKEQGYFAVEVCEAISELLLCFVICEGGGCQESCMQRCNHWQLPVTLGWETCTAYYIT